MNTRQIKFTVSACRWFDRKNGNTYHSVRITRNRDGQTLACPMQYGYGDCYRQTALQAMAANKWLPVKYRGRHSNGSAQAMCYEMENNYPILWNVAETTKRECLNHGQL